MREKQEKINLSEDNFSSWVRRVPTDILKELYKIYTAQKRVFPLSRHDSEQHVQDLQKNKPPPQPETTVLRRSIFLLIITLTTIEISCDIIYFLFRIMPNFLSFPNFLITIISPWYILIFLLLNIIKLILMLSASISWVTTRYELRGPEIRFKYGILFTEERIYIIKYAQEVTCDQSLLGRIFNYGTVKIYNPVLKENIFLDSIPNPKKYTEIIKSSLPNPQDAELVPL